MMHSTMELGVAMIDTVTLLDAAKSRAALPTDYMLSKHLGVYPSAVQNYRAGRSQPDDVIAQRLAELAGMDPDYALACLQFSRAKTDSGRAAWLRIAERLKSAAATLFAAILAVLAVVTPDGGAQAATRAGAGSAYSVSALDQAIHCHQLLRCFAWLARCFAGWHRTPSRVLA